jgi:hypothetical protein
MDQHGGGLLLRDIPYFLAYPLSEQGVYQELSEDEMQSELLLLTKDGYSLARFLIRDCWEKRQAVAETLFVAKPDRSRRF